MIPPPPPFISVYITWVFCNWKWQVTSFFLLVFFFFLLWKTVSRWRKFNHFYHFSSSTVCQKIHDRVYWWCPLCLPSYPQGFFLSLSGLTSTQYLLHLLLVFDVPRAWALLLQWSDVVRLPGTAQDSLLLLLPNYLLLLMELEISHIHEDV